MTTARAATTWDMGESVLTVEVLSPPMWSLLTTTLSKQNRPLLKLDLDNHVLLPACPSRLTPRQGWLDLPQKSTAPSSTLLPILMASSSGPPHTFAGMIVTLSACFSALSPYSPIPASQDTAPSTSSVPLDSKALCNLDTGLPQHPHLSHSSPPVHPQTNSARQAFHISPTKMPFPHKLMRGHRYLNKGKRWM